MTALLTPHTGADPDRSGPDAGSTHLPEATGRRAPAHPALPVVTAILTVRATEPWLPRTLDAIAGQIRPPERLVVVDACGAGAQLRDLVRGHAGLAEAIVDLRLHTIPSGAGARAAEPAAVLAQVLADVALLDFERGEEWLWLLTDATAPEPGALAELVGGVRRSPSVGIAGPKVLDWAQPRHLLEVGHLLTRTGRPIASPAVGEPDQGQFDTRTDVLAVGLSGVLVRRVLFERIGGFEPALGAGAAALDLGWRAQLAGERVVVVPAARVRDAGRYAADGTLRTDQLSTRIAARVAARRVALSRCAPVMVPLLSVWLVVTSVVGALGLLLLKRPAHAVAELADLRALAHPISSVRARWRFRRGRTLRRRDLSTLFVTWSESLRLGLERVQDSLTPTRHDDADLTPGAIGALDSGPVAEEAEDLTVLPASVPQRILTNAGVLMTTVAAFTAAGGLLTSLRGGLLDARGAGLAGGELAAVSTDAAGLWHSYRDGWQGAGLGAPGSADPHVAVLSGLTWLAERLPYVAEGRSPASVLLAWVLLLGMPIATAAAYLAGRVVTRAAWPRALAAAAWGTSGVLAASVSSGRVTVVLAHILLPLVAAGLARLAGPNGTFTAAAATALGAAVLGALVPVFLVPVAVVAVVLLWCGPGAAVRARALAVLVLPIALQGPSLLALRDPAVLLGAAGTLDAAGAEPVPLWQLVLARPDAVTDTSVFGVLVPALPAALLLVPILAATVLALVRAPASRARGASMLGLVTVALAGLGYALFARRVTLGVAPGARADADPVAAVPWPGVGLQLYLLAVLALALLGTVGMRAVLARGRTRWRRSWAAAGLVVVCVAILAGAVTIAASGLDRRPDGIALGRDPLPAVAVDQARGPEAARLLVLSVRADQVDLEIVGAEPGRLLRGPAAPSTPAAVTDPGFGPLVADLAAGRTGAFDAAGAGAAGTHGDRLADLGVGFVSLRATGEPGEQLLQRTLDATPGLTRLGTTDGQTLWRVQTRTPAPGATDSTTPVPAARLRLVTASGAVLGAVPATGPHGATTAELPAGPPGRRLVVAESPQWADHSVLTLDGAPLATAAGGGPPAYQVPATGGNLVIALPAQHPRWLLGQLGLLALTLFLAIPFGNRRSRRLR